MSYSKQPNKIYRSKYSFAFKKQVLQACRDRSVDESIQTICKKFNIHFATIYQWKRQEKAIDAELAKEAAAPAVEPIASTISSAIDKPKKKYNKNIAIEAPATAVRFCPCCGTNIEAVALAMNVVNSASN